MIGQKHTPEGSNEIAVAPEPLKVLMLKGCMVTVYAANCQIRNAQIIVERGGDYVFPLNLRPLSTLTGGLRRDAMC